MRRKTKTSVVTTLTTPTQNCGRSTKSTVWKILFLILGITLALLYRKTDPDTELAAKLGQTGSSVPESSLIFLFGTFLNKGWRTVLGTPFRS